MTVRGPLLFCPELRFVRDLLAQSLGYPLRAPESTDQLDWQRVLSLLQWHGLAGWVLHARPARLAELPESALDSLGKLQLVNKLRVMAQLATLKELQARLDRLGIPLIVLKGIGLSLRHYGDATIRACGDLDLLIPRRHMLRAHAVMEDLGYAIHNPGAAPADVNPVHWKLWHFQELTYVPSGLSGQSITSHCVDLHHRPALLIAAFAPPETVYADAFLVGTGNTRFGVLPAPYQLAALLQHGAVSRWRRLKWVLDIEQELSVTGNRVSSAADISAAPDVAHAYLNFLAVRQALFDLTPGRRIRLNPTIVQGLNSMVTGGPETRRPAFMWNFLLHELSLAPTLSHRVQVLVRRFQWMSEVAFETFPASSGKWLRLIRPLARLYRWNAVRRIKAHHGYTPEPAEHD